jgi:hypothetical protein
MLNPNNPLARHSRPRYPLSRAGCGGNPARKKSGKAVKTAVLSRYAGLCLIVWIPAGAGMTHFCSIELSGLKPNNQSVSCTCSDACRVNQAYAAAGSLVL